MLKAVGVEDSKAVLSSNANVHESGSIRGVQRNRPGSNTRMSMAGNRTVSHADVVMQWDASFISQPSIPHYDPSVGHRVMQNQAAAMNNPLSASATHASNTTPVRMINRPVKGLANTKTTPSGLVDSHKEEKAIKALVSNTLLIACLSDKKVRKEKMPAAERPDLRMGMSKITK